MIYRQLKIPGLQQVYRMQVTATKSLWNGFLSRLMSHSQKLPAFDKPAEAKSNHSTYIDRKYMYIV